VRASVTDGPEQTERAGAELAAGLKPGDVVLVSGELGAGKTTFVRGALRALGVTGPITSPTFVVGHLYDGPLAHLDLYRLAGMDAEDPGLLDDYFAPEVKWPDAQKLPQSVLDDAASYQAPNGGMAFWVAQDACPPAPGCLVKANPLAPDVSGTLDAAAWQYAQSPRRPEITRACAATYNRDGNCYVPGLTNFELDLSSSTSPDPSHGR